MKRITVITAFLVVSISSGLPLFAQETVSVTFRYEANETAQRVFVPGEFNNWGNNTNGRISTTDGSLMTNDAANGFWYKTISLQIGGGNATHNGKSGYAYKFHEQFNASGSEWNWITDPFNSISIGNNNDSFLEVTSPLIFQMGPENGIADSDQELWVTVAAKASDPIDVTESEFYINDVLAGTFENQYDFPRQMFYLEDITNYNFITGLNEFKIVAVTQSGATVSDSLQFTYVGEPQDVDLPRPVGLKDGITYGENGTSATLSLFAPYKKDVFLIGDFTNWAVDLNYKMNRDSANADSIWFWYEITGLTPGQEYGFQYLVDGEVRIADPYSELVLDENNDQFIPSSVYPNLKAYPSGETFGLVSVLRPGKPEFNWTDDNYVRPDKENMVIYELLMRDFFETPSYTALIDTLDYLERLGINAIELMPINEFNGNLSWGYNPTSHYAIDKYYGTPEAFKAFVNEAHNRGIAVIVDIVLNHADNPHTLNSLYNLSSNPYFNTSPRHSYNVFTDFNHQYSGTQHYVKQVVQHWITEYKIDGFRWDLTKGFTQNCSGSNESCTNSYQQDRVDILKQYADYQWEVDPDFIVIFEHLGTSQEEREWADYRVDEGKGILFWGKMTGPYNEATMGYNENNKSNLNGVLSSSKGFAKKHLVGYMESHDEQWLMFKNRSFGACSNHPRGGNGCETDPGSYNVRDLDNALTRQKLAGAFFFTLPGPKMLWQFGEVGYGYGNNGEQCLKPGGSSGDCAPSVPGRTDAKPIRWDYWNSPDTEQRRNLYKTWAALLKLRNSSEAFTNPTSADYSLSDSVKTIIYEHPDTDVLIVGNFSVFPVDADVLFPTSTTWYDYFDGTEYLVTNPDRSIPLEPGTFKLYTTRQFETPEANISVSNEDMDYEKPTAFNMYPNYPNPFNPSTNINYDVASAGPVTLEIFNMLGQKVATLVNETQSVGSYTVRFDASGLSSGVYLARFTAGNTVNTQKMLLVK